MKKLGLICLLIAIISCKQQEPKDTFTSDYTIVFASCSDQDREQPLWKPILENKPDLFIWGGDNIYADTDDMVKMKADYDKVHANPDYAKLLNSTTVIGTWDDHDYGKNDAGVEWEKKSRSPATISGFFKVSRNRPIALSRRRLLFKKV